MPKFIPILLNGARGRMGQAIQAVAAEHHITVAASVSNGDDPAAGIHECAAVVDFSFHTATLPLVELATKHSKPCIIGTTGHSDEERGAIGALATILPMVWAGNFSIGVNLLNALTGQAAETLGAEYQPEVIEMHHRHKRDAPSGSAEQLIRTVRAARGLTAHQERYGRHGVLSERPDAEIGVHAIRGGDIIGEHTVLFAGPGERLELTHRASDRHIFAHGALRAVHWALRQKPGLYTMAHVLDLPRAP